MVHLSQIFLRRCGLEFLTDFTDFTDFRGGVEQVIKRVIISLSEDAWRFLSICFDNGINWARGGGGRGAYLHQKQKSP